MSKKQNFDFDYHFWIGGKNFICGSGLDMQSSDNYKVWVLIIINWFCTNNVFITYYYVLL